MTEILGSNLLGRRVSPPDERDFKLANFLYLGLNRELAPSDPTELIDLGVAELKLTTVTFKKWAATNYVDVTKTHWWQALNYFSLARASLNPVPASNIKEWQNLEPTLDQMDTNHCVGFSGAQWGNTAPIDDKFTNQDGHDIYYECKILDGEPGQENGTDLRSLGKVLKNRQRLTVYAFAASIDEAVTWILQKGPVVFGSDWTEDMFNPDINGLIYATGKVLGGHAYLANGFDPNNNQILFINSWGDWAINGHFRMTTSDSEKLFANFGEALVAVELPL